MTWAGEAWLGLTLAARLPGFLRRPWRVDEAGAVVRERLAHRTASFLALVRGAVYGRPGSPYRALLARAGCKAGDVEDAAPDGAPRLRLLVHPSVGPVDEARVVAAFLDAIAPGTGAERIASLLWRQAGAVQVERRSPFTTASGKVHHVHSIPVRR